MNSTILQVTGTLRQCSNESYWKLLKMGEMAALMLMLMYRRLLELKN